MMLQVRTLGERVSVPDVLSPCSPAETQTKTPFLVTRVSFYVRINVCTQGVGALRTCGCAAETPKPINLRQQPVASQPSFNCRLCTTEEFTPDQSSPPVMTDTGEPTQLLTRFPVSSYCTFPLLLFHCCNKGGSGLFLFCSLLLPTFVGLWDLTHSKTWCCAANIKINKPCGAMCGRLHREGGLRE